MSRVGDHDLLLRLTVVHRVLHRVRDELWRRNYVQAQRDLIEIVRADLRIEPLPECLFVGSSISLAKNVDKSQHAARDVLSAVRLGDIRVALVTLSEELP